jgi:hypothetical protein
VLKKPSPNPAITAAVNAETVEKVDRALLPAGVDVILTGHTTLQDDFAIQAHDAFVLPVLTFYWPGWTAYLDGQPAPIQVTQPEGFISVSIPAGSHKLTLRLTETPPRRLAWLISSAALVMLLGVGLLPRWWARDSQDFARPASLPARPAAVLLCLAAATVLLRVGWDVALAWQAANTQPQLLGVQAQRFTRFDDGVALVAYDFPATQARPGDQLNLTFFWEVTRPTQQAASVFVHFYAPNGALFGQADKPDPVLNRPTNRWPLGIVRSDLETAQIRIDAPSGVYTVAVGLWDRATGRRSFVLDDEGQPTKQDKLILTNQFTVLP